MDEHLAASCDGWVASTLCSSASLAAGSCWAAGTLFSSGSMAAGGCGGLAAGTFWLPAGERRGASTRSLAGLRTPQGAALLAALQVGARVLVEAREAHKLLAPAARAGLAVGGAAWRSPPRHLCWPSAPLAPWKGGGPPQRGFEGFDGRGEVRNRRLHALDRCREHDADA